MCDICELQPAIKYAYSKKYNESNWYCETCLKFTRLRNIMTKSEAKYGRNDLCKCGSEKKVKNCCGMEKFK
jgi:uncharacterized protein YecA (UPF0149 family)